MREERKMKRKIKGFSELSTGSSGFVLLIGAVLINFALQGPSFFASASLSSLLSSNLPLLIATLAQMIIMLSGGIDISLGNNMAMVNAVAIVMANQYMMAVGASWAIALGVGAAIGAMNGLIIAFLRVPPLLVTFATSILIKGLSMMVLPKPGGSVPEAIYTTYGGTLLGVPTAIWLILIAVALLMLMSRFKISKYLTAIGCSEKNAFASGINVEKTKVLAYTIGGFIAGCAGLCLTALTASGDVRLGESFGLTSIAAVIIGGSLQTGKWGKFVGGAVSGALFLAVVNNIVFFAFNIIAMNNPNLQISTYYQQLLSNFIIIFGLASAVLTNKRNYRIDYR
jgi:ribose transport system permease protein